MRLAQIIGFGFFKIYVDEVEDYFKRLSEDGL